MSILNIGIIGAGKMGITHCGAFMNVDNTKVIAAADNDLNKLKTIQSGHWPEIEYYEDSFNSKYRIEKIYENPYDLLENESVEAVIVSTPNESHYKIVLESLKKKKHVLVEKPMTTSFEKALKLVELAKKNNLVFSVGQCWRFHPEIQYAKQIVEKEILGKIQKVKGFGIHESYVPTSSWFSNKKISGGGAVIDMGIHPIDSIRFVLPDLKEESLYANFKTAYGKYDVEDIGATIIRYKNGATGIIEFGWANPHADGVESSIQIFGTKGYMRVFPTELKLTIENEIGLFKPNICSWYLTTELYKRQAKAFIQSILFKKKNINSGEDNLNTIKIIDAIYKSQRENRVVKFDEYIN